MQIKDYIKDFLYCISKELNDLDVIAVKGYFALMTQISLKGFNIDRLSKDLDLQILNSNKWEYVISNIDNINKHSKLNITYELIKVKEAGNIVKYTVKYNGNSLFSIDANKDPKPYQYDKIKIYDIKVNFFKPSVMLADKLSSSASSKIYRRTKDLYDIYLLSTIFEFKLPKLVKCINSKRNIDTNHIELYNPRNLDDLKRGYNSLKLKEGSPKPEFEEVYEKLKYFTYPIYMSLKESNPNRLYWNKEEWVTKDELSNLP